MSRMTLRLTSRDPKTCRTFTIPCSASRTTTASLYPALPALRLQLLLPPQTTRTLRRRGEPVVDRVSVCDARDAKSQRRVVTGSDRAVVAPMRTRIASPRTRAAADGVATIAAAVERESDDLVVLPFLHTHRTLCKMMIRARTHHGTRMTKPYITTQQR